MVTRGTGSRERRTASSSQTPTATSGMRPSGWRRTRSYSTTTESSCASKVISRKPRRWRSPTPSSDREPVPPQRRMGGEWKSMRALVLAIGALALAAACGGIPGGQVSAGGYKLYEAASKGDSQQLSVIDSRSHAVECNIQLRTNSANLSHLYSVKGNILVVLDPQTGLVRYQLPLPGNYKLPSATISGVPGGLSPNG